MKNEERKKRNEKLPVNNERRTMVEGVNRRACSAPHGSRTTTLFIFLFSLLFLFSCDNGASPGHTYQWDAWRVTTTPTCITEGVETRTCALDGAHTETRAVAVDPNAHDWEITDTETAPTCTETGLANGICGRCGAPGEGITIPALGHDYVWTETTAPDCTNAGVETGTCTRDASHTATRAVPIAPNAHAWGGWTQTKAPTDTTEGEETRTCAHNAEHKETRPIPATGIAATPGLAYQLITSGPNDNAYRVRKGAVTGGEVYIPASYNGLPVREIGGSSDSAGAFLNTGITAVHIPGTVTVIGQYAFRNCASLADINIPASVTSIGSSAFWFCSSLTGITVDGGNPNYASEEGILYNKAKTNLIQAPGGISGEVTIPASVTSIAANAFTVCTGITAVTIPAGVTAVGQLAFQSWTAQQTITVQGKNQAAADAAWSQTWRVNCNANIVYQP